MSRKPGAVQERLAASVHSGSSVRLMDRIYSSFEQTLLEFEDAVSSILRLRRLVDVTVEEDGTDLVIFSELLSHIQLCVSGISPPVRVPRVPMYLDALLGFEDLIGGLSPKIGDKNIACLGIDGLPQESWPAILSLLDGLNLSYRFSTRFISLDQFDAQKEITSFRKGWQQNVHRMVDKFLVLPGFPWVAAVTN